MLYIVASPIGNLSDISSRALDVLKKVDYVLCEDTRRSFKLLDRYSLSKRLVSYHEHSSYNKIESILSDLKDNIDIAYLSDAGTPNISDPGGKLCEIAFKNNIKVVPIPGPSALTALISVAPFSCSNFRFVGFWPKKKGRETLIKQIIDIKEPIFFYESPKRIKKTIDQLSQKLSSRKLLIGRELTKIHEQIIVLDLSLDNADNIANIPEKGEFVLAVFE